MTLLSDLLCLFFPRHCLTCGNSLFPEEEVLCMGCRFHLPRTFFERDPENVVARAFWGRIPLAGASAAYHFRKGNRVQQLLHRLKYRGEAHIGNYLGKLLGENIKTHPVFSKADKIIPIPLHPQKLRKRGYNQSERIARGLSEVTGIPIDTHCLRRVKANRTQTKKARYARWENVAEVFAVERPEKIRGKHLLLVDDVITTGATMEAAAQHLRDAGADAVSLLAFASTFR